MPGLCTELGTVPVVCTEVGTLPIVYTEVGTMPDLCTEVGTFPFVCTEVGSKCACCVYRYCTTLQRLQVQRYKFCRRDLYSKGKLIARKKFPCFSFIH